MSKQPAPNPFALPLIVSTERVHRGLLSVAKPTGPDVAVVYATGFGEVATFQGRSMTWSEQVLSKYRLRYEVDVSDHRRKAQLVSSPLPSRGDAYFFDATIDVGFRVYDPELVVRRNVDDALPVVYGALSDWLRPITRTFDIKLAADAESAINRGFPRPLRLEEGIEIFYFSVSLSPDDAAREYLQRIADGSRRLHVGAVDHEVNLATAQQGHVIERVDQEARLAAQNRELESLSAGPLDVRAMIARHLAAHPEQTGEAVELLANYEAARTQQRNLDSDRTSELFRYMAEQGLIHAADVETLRRNTVRQLEADGPRALAGGPAGPALDAGWDEDLPRAQAAIGRIVPSTAKPSLAGNALPVYLAVDESFRGAGYLEALDDGMRRLMMRLAETSAVAGALRFAVLGYSHDVAVRMPMTTVSADGFVPRFAPGDPVRLARLFEYLQRRIPQDVDPLKAGDGDMRVNRPTLHLLTASRATDGDQWPAPLRRLTDRGVFRYAPTIVSAAIGDGDPRLAAETASSPAYAFCAPPGLEAAEAVSRYVSFLEKAITRLALSQVGGASGTDIDRPVGFRPAAAQGGNTDG
jgi:hypothetical protein